MRLTARKRWKYIWRACAEQVPHFYGEVADRSHTFTEGRLRRGAPKAHGSSVRLPGGRLWPQDAQGRLVWRGYRLFGSQTGDGTPLKAGEIAQNGSGNEFNYNTKANNQPDSCQ